MPMLLPRLTAAALLLAAAPALADSPFDGTWKAQLSSMHTQGKPDTFTIRNGTYRCETCQPSAYSVPADGKFHAVSGRPYWDALAVSVVDDHAVRYQFQKDGRVISENTDTVSADGATLTRVSHNTNNGGNVPVDVSSAATRLGAAVPGAHLTSGNWQFKPATTVSDAALTVTLRLDGDRFHMETGLGETLDATVGGPYALNVGDPGKTMTKVERVGAQALRLTDMRDGKVDSIATYTLAADGTLAVAFRDPPTGRTGGATLTRQ